MKLFKTLSLVAVLAVFAPQAFAESPASKLAKVAQPVTTNIDSYTTCLTKALAPLAPFVSAMKKEDVKTFLDEVNKNCNGLAGREADRSEGVAESTAKATRSIILNTGFSGGGYYGGGSSSYVGETRGSVYTGNTDSGASQRRVSPR